ncbi:uncharacterized protein NECHADRAFT_88829 [Fusarium vanettenii 77-13-4]|uniref:Uncharacterized protein n=1 Tax=Fusarium vanettenii (strain ATCC MYA-4622 / CBS 123669 / FGSC 9596 / NRRL 45880 / 77-13-4) TaxID=660122 RepID=C7ZN71_FUSV7|nr:uncharacterized protein NECHADRAFT_88829 [Fusarium vanettenii 77-13-4]EEU34535.1 hypothetical protein NECHADRAFT_88829 [Fusarium vanettenii 77-13-4]
MDNYVVYFTSSTAPTGLYINNKSYDIRTIFQGQKKILSTDPKTLIRLESNQLYRFVLHGGDIRELDWQASGTRRKKVPDGCRLPDLTSFRLRPLFNKLRRASIPSQRFSRSAGDAANMNSRGQSLDKLDFASMKIQHPRRIHSFVFFRGSLSSSGASPLKSLFIGADAASKVAAEQEDGDRELQGDAALPSMAQQWECMKNYSTWASNGKVFLYPENLTEPSLRVNESPFFKELDTELDQNELTKETVSSMMRSYMTKLADVSNLEPVSLYLQRSGGQTAVVHLFDRAWNAPSDNYNRSNSPKTKQRTAWTKMAIETPRYVTKTGKMGPGHVRRFGTGAADRRLIHRHRRSHVLYPLEGPSPGPKRSRIDYRGSKTIGTFHFSGSLVGNDIAPGINPRALQHPQFTASESTQFFGSRMNRDRVYTTQATYTYDAQNSIFNAEWPKPTMPWIQIIVNSSTNDVSSDIVFPSPAATEPKQEDVRMVGPQRLPLRLRSSCPGQEIGSVPDLEALSFDNDNAVKIVTDWRNNTFRPHPVARSRPLAYKKWIVIKYIKILIAYGDFYFRQITLDSIPNAIHMYVLASHLYRPWGQKIPRRHNSNLSSVLSSVNGPMPTCRFQYLLGRAIDMAVEAKSFGNALLTANEKFDGETMAALLVKHESIVYQIGIELKKNTLREARAAVEAREDSRKAPAYRLSYYLMTPGMDQGIPGIEDKFQDVSLNMLGPVEEGNLKLLQDEKTEMGKLSESPWSSEAYRKTRDRCERLPLATARLYPRYTSGLRRGIAHRTGQRRPCHGRLDADALTFQSSKTCELKAVDKQILSSKIRVETCEQEIEQQETQVEQAREVEEYLQSKYTNAELCPWMAGVTRSLFSDKYNRHSSRSSSEVRPFHAE